jgi:hypothetical protein
LFDWDDDAAAGINVEEISTTVVADAISAGIDACEEVFGWRWLKPTDVKDVAKKLYKTRYIVKSDEQRKWIESEWPEYVFDWSTATKHHDHPVSHLATELNELEMVYDLVVHNRKYVDLFGNPSRDARYKRNAVVMTTRATPKDFLRYQKTRYNEADFDLEALCDPNTSLGRINDVTCTHALYYMSIADIARIVNTSQKRRFRALVHRHSQTSGEFHFGELKYKVSEDGTVRQTNSLTGEEYEHPSCEALFHQFSAKTEHGGVTWTINKSGGDAFIIDFVACPNDIASEFVRLIDVRPETREVIELDGVRVSTFLGWSWMTYDTGKGVVEIEDCDLFSKLRRYVSGRPRTNKLMEELFQHARRLTNKADIISIHGGGPSNINVACISDYVHAAFYIDVRKELETAIAFHKANKDMVAVLNEYYASGTMPKDFTGITRVLARGARIVGEASKAVPKGLEALGATESMSYLKKVAKSEVQEAVNLSVFANKPRLVKEHMEWKMTCELPNAPRRPVKPAVNWLAW